jgi:enoyl-CoA hydratase/carnithine racemase
MTAEIDIRVEGKAGRITLSRPDVLNALSHDMVRQIAQALRDWQENDVVRLVIIEGAGERAFCAGGDIQLLYYEGRSNPDIGRQFWFDEYRLNAQIHHYPKPYVAVMDGIAMGGGVGVSAHGSHRIVTERTIVAMPEAGIGFMPDVGSTRLLADAPGWTGLHLGLTAYRMNAADAIYADFADTYVPIGKLEALTNALIESGNVSVIGEFSKETSTANLAAQQDLIDNTYNRESLMEVVKVLEAGNSDWHRETLAALRRVSPSSAVATFEAVRRAKTLPDLESCLVYEYRFSYRCLDGNEFFEGIRAAVIDKDRKPNWNPPRIEDVEPKRVSSMFAPLGKDEWSPRP